MSEAVRRMFSEIAPKYDISNTVLSAGIHHQWRTKAVRLSSVKYGDSILDCATGTGDLAIAFAKVVGNDATVIGTDFCAPMMETAPEKSKKHGVNITFQEADVMNLPFDDNTFSASSIGFGIRNVDSPQKGIDEMARVVKPNGKVVILEFGQPKGLFGTVFQWYSTKVLPIIGGIITGKKDAYTYLQETSAKFPCREEFVAIMNSTGRFSDVKYYPVSGGIAYIYIGTVR